MRKAVYNDEIIMNDIMSAKRYVDDGAGLFNGSRENFNKWIDSVNEKLCPFGLTIDESCICPPNDHIAFLDIQFCFDIAGSLQTDLYTKPTDSRAYLNFNSAHPIGLKNIFFSSLNSTKIKFQFAYCGPLAVACFACKKSLKTATAGIVTIDHPMNQKLLSHSLLP